MTAREDALDRALVAVGTAGLASQEAQAAADAARGKLRAAVARAHRLGASEYLLATYAGVTRQTIRSWLGK